MSSPSDVVITGLGVVSPIGIGCDDFWQSLKDMRSGVGRLSYPGVERLPVPIGAEVVEFEPKNFVKPRKALKVMCREIQLAVSAADMAIKEAGIESGQVDPDRVGVVFGSEMHYGDLFEVEHIFRRSLPEGKFDFDAWGKYITSDIFPLWMLKYLPNMAACHVGIAIDARGPNNTICNGDASSLLAVMESVSTIQRGLADVMITGGTGSRINVTPSVYRGDANLSHRIDDPTAASRPFDADRDGLVNGEGSGAIVLESRRHAAARGATVIASIAGAANTFETSQRKATGPSVALQRAIHMTLNEGNLTAGDVGHVNAHAAGLVREDASEAQSIRAVLDSVPVTAPKSLFGNLGSGSGIVELIDSVLALQNSTIPGTLNYTTPDPACPVNVIANEAQPSEKGTALAISLSALGQTAVVGLRAEA